MQQEVNPFPPDRRERYPMRVRAEIARHVDDGFTPAQIARAMSLSSEYVRTVKALYSRRTRRPAQPIRLPVISDGVLELIQKIHAEENRK